MFLFMMYTGCNLLLLTSPTLALHLPSSPHSTSSAPVPLPTNKTLPALALITPDFSNLTSNYSLGVDRSAPVCDGNLLGFDLNRYSCLQAWNTIPTNSLRLNFGDRLSGTFDVQLPRRFSGPDGTCVIDIFHKDGVISDKASYYEISRAAEILYGVCVARGGQRAQGGWVRDIGSNRNLVLVLSIYDPAVACFGQHFTMTSNYKTWQNLLSLIPVSTERQTFGPEGELGVQVVLPIIYSVPRIPSSRTYGVTLKVDVDHRTTVNARWFDVWAGAAAVTAMCTVRGYAGISGLLGGLSVTLEAVLSPGIENETASF